MPERLRRQSPADHYRRLWASEAAPNLESFVARLPELTADELLDVIELDRAERWRRKERVKAERYLRDFPTVGNDPEAALVVIYGEYYLRKELGELPSLVEYIARFPLHARRLRDQVMWHEAIELNTVIGGPPAPTIEIPGLALGELLGRGGMCSVYRAVENETNAEVAVKILDREHLHHPQRVARFRREVGSLMRLHHPNIVRANRTGDVKGIPYIVMEFCAGGSLATRIAGRPLPASEVVAILRSLASAVEYAHGEGVIHRDLKPGNILLQSPPAAVAGPQSETAVGLETGGFGLGVVKVSDFGLAKCDSGIGSSITASSEALGTPCYMAPELTTGARDADTRTDVYGLGAIFYELLTGRPPFVANTPLEVVLLVREEAPIRPSMLNPAVPPGLESICMKCLAKEPEDRFASAAQLAEAFVHTPTS